MEQHYALEVDKLNKLNKKLPSPTTAAATSSPKNGESSKSSQNADDDCWGTYQKIKNNRQSRLKVKL